MIQKLAYILLLLLFCAVTSFGAVGGGDTGPKVFSITAWTWHIINFGLFAALIVWFYKSKVKGLLRAARSSTEEHINRAGAVLRTAESEIEAAEAKLKHLPAEAVELAEAYKEEGKRLARKQLEDAREEAKSIEHEAERRLVGERKHAEQSVRTQMLQSALEKAEAQIVQSAGAEVDKGLKALAVKAFQE